MTDPTRDDYPSRRLTPNAQRFDGLRDDFTRHYDATVYGTPSSPDAGRPAERAEHTQEINPPHFPRHIAPEPPPPPRPVRRWPAFAVAFFATAMVLLVIGYVAVSRNAIALPGHAFEDSGVAACRVLAASDDGNPAPKATGSTKASFEKDAETRAALLKLRKMFNGSHFEAIKHNGVALMDLSVQLFLPQNSNGDPERLGAALLTAKDWVTLYAGLSGACGDKGVTLKPLST